MTRKVKKAKEITDARISFVSLVDKAANKRQFLIVKDEEGKAAFTTYGKIIKTDSESHFVTGVVYEPMVEDAHGNYMTADEIAKAAYWFAKNGKPALALEFRSTLEEQNLRIRPLSLPEGVKSAKTGAMKLRVPAERTAVLLIPVEAASQGLPGGKLRLMIYDGKASQTLEVPVEEQRFIRSGPQTTRSGLNSGSLQQKKRSVWTFRSVILCAADSVSRISGKEIVWSSILTVLHWRILSAASIARIHSVCFFQPERRANLRVWMFWVM